MKIISLLISLFGIIKTKEFECVSVIKRKCMPRPKILDLNKDVGEALFSPYRVNMQVYNFLMRLNETRNVLRHESCKCVCKLNSSVCNSKQIWNSDIYRCDCNEDFAGIISCDKGYMWNPSTCESQFDTWCKPGQDLDHKNCICKNKLIGRVIEECTSIINEIMINNKDNIDNNNTIWNVFIGSFSVVILIGVICLCVIIFKCIKSKKLF